MYVITLNRPIRGRLWIKGSAAQVVVLSNGGIRVSTTIISPGATKAFSPSSFWPYRKVMAALEKQGFITLTRKHAVGEVELAEAQEPEIPSADDNVLPEELIEEAPAPVEPEITPAPEPEPEPVLETESEPIDDPEPVPADLETKSMVELKELADAAGVAYKSNISKIKLIEKLHEAGVE